MTKLVDMELTQEEMNVVINGMNLVLSLDGLSEGARVWYTNVKNRFIQSYVKEFK